MVMEQVIDMTPAEKTENMSAELGNTDTFPVEIPVKEEISKLGLMWPRSYAEFHRVTPLLNSYAIDRCPVQCGPDWSEEKILKLLRQGPHRSARVKAAIRQLRQETVEKIKHGYARVVKWRDIRDDIPKKLKISPVAMIPHKSKPFRCIMDLSFTLQDGGKRYKSVNETTNKQAKWQSMAQLGLCIQRMVATLADNYDTSKLFHFVKLDIKDGFWCMTVLDDNAWNFAYVLLSLKELEDKGDIELVVPNSLQMGWCESPPFFCSGSETARDIITHLMTKSALPPHRIEHDMLADIMEDATNKKTNTGDITLFEVFVDNFVGLTNNGSIEHLQKISGAMIHGIHSIFPPPDITKHSGEDPISEKKIAKGEGIWAVKKEILGWIFNRKTFTIWLPSQKIKDIIKLIRGMLKMKRPSLNKYQKLAGKLQHASLGLPGGKGLFSPIQLAMQCNPEFVLLTCILKQCLKDWQAIIRHMEKQPTSVLQLVKDYPAFIGYSDSCEQCQ
jgi:hypothetical protein